MTGCIEGILQIFKDGLPIVIYTGHCNLLPAKLGRCVLSDLKIQGTSVSPSLDIALTSISRMLSSNSFADLYLPAPVSRVHFTIKAFWWRIMVNTFPKHVNMMLDVGCLPHQPSHACNDVSTAELDRALVTVIPSYIVESVKFLLSESHTNWHASHEVLDAIPIFEAWETYTGVFFHQQVVIVRLHTCLSDSTPVIVELLTDCEQVVRRVL